MKKNDSKAKQVILIRKDLNMSPGKLGAQVAHASVAALLFKAYRSDYQDQFNTVIPEDSALTEWLGGYFTKICLAVNSKEELIEFYKKAFDAGLRVSLIEDAGFTEFNEPTFTCVGIGPELNEEIDKITGKLKLYR